jgi:hypothetical protein
MVPRLHSYFFRVLHEIICNDWGLFVELAIETERGGRQDMVEKSEDHFIKLPA